MTLKHVFLTSNQKINAHAIKFTQPYITFAIFGIITYPFYYWIWRVNASQGYENLELRLIAVFFCTLLLLKDYWPKKIQIFFPLFWYVTLLYSVPFLFTFLLLKNHMSYSWSMNTMTVLVLSVLLLDLLSLFIILFLGVSLGVACFLITGGALELPSNASIIFITYGSILFFGAVFSYRKDQLREREKRIAAEAANQAKSDFISNMEHDLRTPFAGIGGVAGVLDSLYAETYPELKDLFKILVTSCTQWENIHNRIFDAIDTEQTIQIAPFYLQDELDKIQQLMQATAHIKQVDFVVEYAPREKTGQIETDSLLLSLIISNLVGNAFNFTEKGCITIKAIRHDNSFVIDVIDTGIGIPQDKLDYIFEKFAKLAKSNSYGNVFKGMGLGLYTARKDAKKIKGTISVTSKEGKGSAFRIIIPLRYYDSK